MSKGIEFISEEGFPKVPFILEGISSRFIRENKIVPIDLHNNILKIIMENPDNKDVIEALRISVPAEVMVYTGDGKAIENYIARFYGQDAQDFNTIIENIDEAGMQRLPDVMACSERWA